MATHVPTAVAGSLAVLVVGFGTHAGGLWVEFADETAMRLAIIENEPALSTEDTTEKDYAWGDLDLDGDTDLVVARKVAYSFDPSPNVLFMNEGIADGWQIDGVLVDRTAQFAAASDVDGDMGFLTATNDRDIAVADINNDGWLDVITAVAWANGEPKHLSHPRVYINLGERDGQWLGLMHEDARIPLLAPGEDGRPGPAPRFASVSVGDVTGDGFADLFFTDFDRSEAPFDIPTFDFDNRLLVNDGDGSFVDETMQRLTKQMFDSAYGASGAIADMNGDGVADIVRQSSNLNPLVVAVIYNNPSNVGIFNQYDVVYAFPQSPYFVSVGELNGDGRLDLIITDNNTDRYMLNQGNDANGVVQFAERQFLPPTGNEFGGNSIAADLDDDGFNDVLITDMDVDVPGCFRRMHIWHNQANPPDVTFEEKEVIPFSQLNGTHDVAVFDIDGDGMLDLVVGRCGSTEVYINQNESKPDPADLDGDGVVGGSDLLMLLNAWGQRDNPADLDGSGTVGGGDLLILLNAWG